MFRNSELRNLDLNSSDVNSDDATDKFSRNETVNDDDNISQPYLNNSSCNEKSLDSFRADFQNVESNSHLIEAAGEDRIRPPFTVSKSWNYRPLLSDKQQTRQRVNLNKVKRIRVKKPSLGISRSKSNSSSLCDTSSLKKRPKLGSQSGVIKKRSVPRGHQKRFPYVQNVVNGLSNATTSAVGVNRKLNTSNPVSKSPLSASSSFPWRSSSQKETESIPDEIEESVGEYAQYLELKPSVKFKCCRCGINDFSSMGSLQGHIATCNGPAAYNDSTSHSSSPVRTMKPLASIQTASPDLRITRKVFLCSSCGTYYQNYNLYIHMRDKHNKQICLFCRNIFSRSDQLWDHLVTAHKLNSVNYSNLSQIKQVFKSPFYITCCSCNLIFSDDEPFNEHACEIGNFSNAAKAISHTENQPDTATAETTESDLPITDFNNSLAECPRRESSSSAEEEEELKAELQNKFMSRGSTLDFIGVPEDHTVTSVTDEWTTMTVKEESAPVLQNMDESIPDVPSIPEGVLKETLRDEDDHVAPLICNSGEREELLPGRINETDEPEDEPQPPDTNGILHTSPKLPALENRTEFAASSTIEEDSNYAINNEENNFVNDANDIVQPPSIAVNTSSDAAAEAQSSSLITTSSNIEDGEPQIRTPSPAQQSPPHEETENIPLPLPMALMLDKTVDSMEVQALIKECIRTSCLTCLYCSNATLIAVNGYHLVKHLLAEHRFMPTKYEDEAQKVIQKMEGSSDDLKSVYMNASCSSHREIIFDGTFACLQCSFTTLMFKDLCHHKRRTHHKVIFLCIMCKCNFQFYSQLLCHLCPGAYLSESLHTLTYHCCYCDVDIIPSAFRLMVHLRKVHQACDICLARYADQSELYTHIIKQHKVNHLCYKCNLAWRSRDDINKHLFWKHGTESVLCKKCLQKKWPHAYHFCIPASTYTCDECNQVFSKAVALTVHRRAHNGEFPFSCDLCEQRCISKRLLAAHREVVHHIMREPQTHANEKKELANNDDGGIAGLNSSQTQVHQESHNGAEESKDRRNKKKRKKAKNGNEKPLLDELPPLNLSSESDEDSVDEPDILKGETGGVLMAATGAKDFSAPMSIAVTDPPSEEQQTLLEESHATETIVPDQLPVKDLTAVDSTVDLEAGMQMGNESDLKLDNVLLNTEKTENKGNCSALSSADLIEKMLNCLIIEHAYCIPDSIFLSEVVANNQSALSEGSDNANIGNRQLSPKGRSKHDKSCCNKSSSATPRKRKHIPKKDSSSSDSSSDSDSSSSSCGSNCSCNKSASNCSSSSSSESTTPEKRSISSKKKGRGAGSKEDLAKTKTTSDNTNINVNNVSACEQVSLNVPESDLDTDVSASDEDFYEEHPFYIPPSIPVIETKPGAAATGIVSTPPHDISSFTVEQNKFAISRESSHLASLVRNDGRTKKSKKKPKITINLGDIQRSSHLAKSPFSKNVGRGVSSAGVVDESVSSSVDYRVTPSSASSSFPPYSSTPNMGGGVGTCGGSVSYPESPLSQSFMNYASSTSMTPATTLGAVVTSSGSGSGINNSGRLSKRKRVKNKFYGYSSSDENSGRESLKTTIHLLKKRPSSKKPSKSRHPFIGIRTKRPPGLILKSPYQHHASSVSAASSSANGSGSSGGISSRHVGSSSDFYRISAPSLSNTYHQQLQQQQQPQHHQPPQQRNFLKPIVPESSDNSDSDEKCHKLVINLPNAKEKKFNNRLSYGFSTLPSMMTGSGAGGDGDSVGANRWFMQPRQQLHPSQSSQLHRQTSQMQQQQFQQQLLSSSQTTPNKKEVYCFCQCPYDEVSEMIACDGPSCAIEWFHFECVGILTAPQGKWFCPNCRKNPENISHSSF